MASASIKVRLKPRASRCAVKVCGPLSLEISVTSPPVDNQANNQLIELLADCLGMSRKAIFIIKGEHNRNKVIRVEGVAEAELESAIGRLGNDK